MLNVAIPFKKEGKGLEDAKNEAEVEAEIEAFEDRLLDRLGAGTAARVRQFNKKLNEVNVKIRILLGLYQVLTTLGVVFDFPPLPFYDGLMINFNLVTPARSTPSPT